MGWKRSFHTLEADAGWTLGTTVLCFHEATHDHMTDMLLALFIWI